jgi:4-amino-4-deoxy-L-arabinose transferase-like glycosyltransferase
MMGEARRHGGTLALLLLAFALALALRLLVWHWHEFYPLGGDEQEYLHQALTLLREHRYEELRLMRPPLYGVFLAGTIYLFDSLVQRLRLVQAIISAATVVPVWLLTAELARWYRPAPSPPQPPTPNPQPPTPNPRPPGWPPLLAALLCALSYTLADYATELLTETLFLFGLTVLLWLLVRAAAPGERRPYSAAAAGLVLGALCLTRSVGVVLLPLGALWLLSIQTGEPGSERSIENRQSKIGNVLVFVLACALVILPWTVRNYATYGGFILVDTTGPENLWLDNDPAGREAVKAQLYALGDDRATRQQLATARGLEAITGHPQHFARKAWGELLAFFALEYTDDMLERPVIWVPPAEVWARLLLGDGLWLLALLAGVVGFCTVQPGPTRAGCWAPGRAIPC